MLFIFLQRKLHSAKLEGGETNEETFMDEIRLRSKRDREPMSDERLHTLLNYSVGIIAEVLGFALALVVVLCMAGVLK